jgi:AcrR family transcriptional regulator
MVRRGDGKVKSIPKYTMRKRAERQARTRQRIVEATVALHEEDGPLRTTIVAVASRAGVTRPTVYSHFPDDLSLFRACATHYRAANPPPDPTPWMAQQDPEARLLLALADIYAYYRQTEAMTLGLLRDEPYMPHLRLLEGYHRFTDEIARALAAGWKLSAKRQRLVLGGVAHAVEFLTWHDFKVRGLADGEIADLMAGMVVATTMAPRC